MRKLGIIIIALCWLSALYAQVPTRYYVGISEVSESFFKTIPDNLKTYTSEFDYDTVKIKAIELSLTHYLDSVSTPGKFVVKERSKDEVENLLNRLKSLRNDDGALKLQVDDPVPPFSLQNFRTHEIEKGFPKKGTCYLLSFWATWCGNCLEELKHECLPMVAKQFSENINFRFIPVCIDSTASELEEFFEGGVGSKWAYLADLTYLDVNRNVNEIFSTGGHLPLNVIIGPDGLVKYIHLGKISEKEDLKQLQKIISEAFE